MSLQMDRKVPGGKRRVDRHVTIEVYAMSHVWQRVEGPDRDIAYLTRTLRNQTSKQA